MDKNSRTAKSLKNSMIALGYYVFNLVLQFFSRKIFLNCLGTEILGLNSTALNLLQFLNLAELGISAAVGFTLYKPLDDEDHVTINEIVTLQGHLYKRIALIIIGGAALLMAFFPWIFAKIELPLWYAYASFGVFLSSSLLGYFVNYKQIVLTASQQDYRILFSYRSVMILKVLIQIVAVKYLSYPYIWWLGIELVSSIVASISLSYMTKRTFPFLKTVDTSFKNLRMKYPEFTVKIKQLFFHKIGSYALTQSSPIIIYAYTTLTIVALYGNYLIITTGITALITAVFNSMNASVGNLLIRTDTDHSMKILNELFSLRFSAISIICFVTYVCTPSFISLWIGEDYILSNTTLILMLLILHISLSRLTVESFIYARGLFKDIYAPIVEAVINIGGSVLFGYFWGMNGVLLGVLSSLIIVVLGWKPYFLFSNEFKGHYGYYLKQFFKNVAISLISILPAIIIVKYYFPNVSKSIAGMANLALLATLVYGGVLISLAIVSKSGLELFFIRLGNIYRSRTK